MRQRTPRSSEDPTRRKAARHEIGVHQRFDVELVAPVDQPQKRAHEAPELMAVPNAEERDR